MSVGTTLRSSQSPVTLTSSPSVYVESRKRSYLPGSSCDSLRLVTHGTCNRIYSSLREPFSRSSHSADGAPFSSGLPAAGLLQGAAGLLLIAGTLGMAAKIMWQKAAQVASLPPTYEAILEFPFASGITIGTVVRIRGVDVGSVINVRPCLERIDAKIQVMDSTSYIPRNALVEVNQSGLVGETIIDITPVSPVPRPSVGPLDPGCPSEGLIVCDKERVKGQQGVSMDDLMRLCGKMAKNTKESDVRDFIKTAEHLGDVVGSSKLLLEKLENFAENVEPVVKDLQDRRLFNSLTELLKQASATVHNLRMSKLTLEHKRSFSNSMANLAATLNDMESTSEELTNFFKSGKNQKNMKHLVELLSRLVDG
ncbi:hypothetical protein GOP47_0006578 [Adiantum capillus-veneris]|uniref:Mce/MlaD domain-containing protein n=1 Tax=Adiantum capillus-veneris TaxID=13818 RepID=A0A9D4ZM67_ADICA|nr:hypothetical protein GOP47_0006578 [Adiantum capillus-veneris]